MSLRQGFHYLQVDSNDKTKVEKFRVAASGTKSAMKKRADNMRNRGKRARVIKDVESGKWVLYTRG